MAFKFMFY